VVDRDNLDFFFNPFWSNEKRCYSIVTEANEKYFSIYKPSRYGSAIEEGLSCGANEYMVFYQETGKTKNWASSTILLHVEKDKDKILEIIKNTGNATILKETESIKRERDYLESKLAIIQRRYEENMKLSLEFVNGEQ